MKIQFIFIALLLLLPVVYGIDIGISKGKEVIYTNYSNMPIERTFDISNTNNITVNVSVFLRNETNNTLSIILSNNSFEMLPNTNTTINYSIIIPEIQGLYENEIMVRFKSNQSSAALASKVQLKVENNKPYEVPQFAPINPNITNISNNTAITTDDNLSATELIFGIALILLALGLAIIVNLRYKRQKKKEEVQDGSKDIQTPPEIQ